MSQAAAIQHSSGTSKEANETNENFLRLTNLLKELFQLDQPDLDFGYYRIMQAKSEEVQDFLGKDLLPQVKDAFKNYQNSDKTALETELQKAIEQAAALGVKAEDAPKVKEIKERLTTSDKLINADQLEREVFDHLYSFFRRYYSEGDFLSKRVYKQGVYAIPYEGEEVKLHWANKDQYYIKTSEYLRDYTFKLHPEDVKKPLRVHFKLKEAAEGEHNNIKTAKDKERRFVLAKDSPIAVNGDELEISFEYRIPTESDFGAPIPKKGNTIRTVLNGLTEKKILNIKDAKLANWILQLQKKHINASGEETERSKLAVHLDRYTARHDFDYFIHKDLGGFLKRELDFFIKNEILHLDDVENDTAPKVSQYLSKIKVTRKIACKIIDFIAQLEDFQKKLWLKKKFVTETNYCLTLDKIPSALYPAVAENDAQRDSWVKLFAIDEIKKGSGVEGYSKPLSVKFLQENQFLVVDTGFFDGSFKEKLLDSIKGFENQQDGLLVHGENFQAIQLLSERYKQEVKCIYIDPPYNTDASPILYKNGYKSSSWSSLMNDRLLASISYLKEDGVLIAAIDDAQQRELNFIMSEVYNDRILGTICVRANPSGRPMQTGYSVSHEYLIFAGKSAHSIIGRLPPTKEQMARFNEIDDDGPFEWRNLRREGSNSDRSARRRLYYPLYLSGKKIRVPKMELNEETEEWIVHEHPMSGEKVVYPDNDAGEQKTWRWEWSTVIRDMEKLAVRPDRSGKDYVYYKRRPHEEGVVSVSSWFEAKYSATEHGTALLKDMFGKSPFSYPKSLYAVIDAIYVAGASEAQLVFDYFAGSGTTGHAAIALNREYGGNRKYILSEMGEHFDSVIIPRLCKAIYSKDWSEGKPQGRIGISHCFKYIRMESYEDTLNNLTITRTKAQNSLLEHPLAKGADKLREDYILRYMMEKETKGSPSLLNVEHFADPTSYKLKIKTPNSDENREVIVDLLETFNYLIGLKVEHIAASITFNAKFKTDFLEGRQHLDGEIAAKKDGKFWFRKVTGITQSGRKTLIIWRKLTGNAAEDNLVLDAYVQNGLETEPNDFKADVIYVNGDNNLENARKANDNWKVRLIEEDFQRLMFDVGAK